MGDLIPDRVMEGRSSLGKQLTKDRYYQRAKKSVIVAYVWFLFGGMFAAHRFYLGRWKSGIAILALIWFLWLGSFSRGSAGVAMLMILIILAIELVLVWFLTKWTNEKIKRDFDREVF